MTFVHFFSAGYFFFILNAEKAFGFEQATLLSKCFLVAGALGAVATRPRISSSFFLACAAVLLVFVTATFTRFNDFQWGVWLRALNNVIVPFFLLSVVPDEKDRNLMLRTLAWAPIVSILVGTLYQMTGRSTLFGVDHSIGGVRLQGSLIPAFLAGIALTGAISSLFLTRCYDPRYVRFAVVNLVILLLTAGRTPIALAVFICGYFFFFELDIARHTKVAILVAGAFSAVGTLVTIGSTLVERFSSNNMSGRVILWRYLYTVIDRYWDFGVGLGHAGSTIPHAVSVLVGGIVAPHNEFIRLAAELGVIGAALYILIYILIIVNAWRRAQMGRPIVFLTGVGFLLLCYTDNAYLTPTYYPMLFAASFWALCPLRRDSYPEIQVCSTDGQLQLLK